MELSVDEAENEYIQLVIFHNSETIKPHVVLAHVDLSIGELANLHKNTDDDVLTFNNQKFTLSSGTIQFEVELIEDLTGRSTRDAVPKVYTIASHKFRVKEFPKRQNRQCVICNKLLWLGCGVECEHCEMVTHRQCCHYVLTKCRDNPIKLALDNTPSGRFELDQEHQFPPSPFRVSWAGLRCSHCGDNFWWTDGVNNPRAFAYKCEATSCKQPTYVHDSCK